jgi:alpha-amylase
MRPLLARLFALSLLMLHLAAASQPTREPLREGWHNGVFMEIFVRAFRDSDGDGHGDLKGLTQSLPYLQNLGVRGIWLMPITHNADGDHGYATYDFRAIDPKYGTLADFDELITEAHRRGIGVIMDYVLNHAAATHPYFQSAVKDVNSPYRDWFIWSSLAPVGWEIWGKNPWYPTPTGHLYATFGPHMPDFNFRNPAVLAYHLDSLRFWLDRGIDGFRFDAVPHLVENSSTQWNDQPESYDIMRHVMDVMRSYPNRFAVCEATANPVRWSAPNVCGSAFAFGLEHRIMDAVLAKPGAAAKLADYFTIAPGNMSTMLANHDLFAGERIWDQVKGHRARYKMAAASLLLLPGTPFIYYGEEIGMSGALYLQADPKIRTPYSWTGEARTAGFTTGTPFRALAANAGKQNHARELRDPAGLMAHYQSLIALRNQTPALAKGDYRNAAATGHAVSFQREYAGDKVLVILNYGNSANRIEVANLPKGAVLMPLWSTNKAFFKATVRARDAGKAMIAIPAHAAVVYRVLPR